MTDGRTRDPDATRAAILQAAEEAFVEKGYADVAVSEIAEAAEVTKSLIHHHFGSKEKLWDEVKHHRFEEYAAVQRHILENAQPDAELLRRSVRTYFKFLQKHPGFSRMVAWMHLEEAEDQPFDVAEGLMEKGIEAIRAAQEQGELRGDVHPFFMLVTFLGMAEQWFQAKEHHCQWCEDDSELRDDDAYLDAMVKIFFEGVLPRDAG